MYFIGVPYVLVPRSIQWDQYSCGARSTWSVMRYFKPRQTPPVETLIYELILRRGNNYTDEDDIVEYLRSQGLRAKRPTSLSIKDVQKALFRGGLVIGDFDDFEHYAVVHGMSDERVYIADSSLVRCPGRSHTWKKFKKRFSERGIRVFPDECESAAL